MLMRRWKQDCRRKQRSSEDEETISSMVFDCDHVTVIVLPFFSSTIG